MDYKLGFISLLIGYLAGSINFARIITRLKASDADLGALTIDMEEEGETDILGGYGAASASMVLGPKLGISIAILDMLKVIIPMLVFKLLFKGEPYYLFTSIGGLLGHNYPVYYGFKGGRGMSVLLGSFLVVDWVGPPATILIGLFLVFVLIGNPMAAYILWIFLMIPWLIWRSGSPEVIYTIAMTVIFFIGAIPDIRNMMRMKRSGNYEAYTDGLYRASIRLGWMKKMTDRLWILRPLFEKGDKKTINQPPE